jgi:hypothetical protein
MPFANLCGFLVDFLLRAHRLSTSLRSNVSRQQSRCFNDLQCLTPPTSATAFDNRRRISLKAKYLALEGHLREGAFESGARAVPAGGTTHSAPGRLRASCPPALRPVRGVLPLGWDRRGRVTLAGTKSQETWPGAEPRGQSLGESRGGAPRGERVPLDAHPRPKREQVATSDCVARIHGTVAPTGAPPPFIFLEAKDSWRFGQNSGAGASRE